MSILFRITKRHIIFLIIAAMSICLSLRASAWEKPYAKLTIYAFGDAGAKAASGNQGHTWLTITNTSGKTITFLDYEIKPGQTISVSIWPDSSPNTEGYGGVFINLEMIVDKGMNVTSYSMDITEDQFKKIEKASPKESYYHDGQNKGTGLNITDDLWHNCTTYSTKMWNLVADKKHKISNGTIGVDVPGTVAKKIAKWDGSRQQKYTPSETVYWGDVVHITKEKKTVHPYDYKDLYRKELENGTFKYTEGKNSGTFKAKYFLLVNIDQKGVPELIVAPELYAIGHTGYIYTLRNRKLSYCGSYSHKGFRSFKYVKKYKSVYYSWWTNGIGGSGAQLLKMDSNGKLRPYKFFYECFKSMYSTKKLFYYGKSGIKDSKKVSQKKFKKLNVKYLGKKLGKVKTYEFNANTKTNRNKYLK